MVLNFSVLKNRSSLLVILIFVAYFVLGLFLVNDYGISMDEPTERWTSHRQYLFAVSKLYYVATKQDFPGFSESHVWHQNMLQGTRDRNYGTFLQWPAVVYEHLNNFSLEPSQYFGFRHRLNFVYFFCALVCFYILLKERFQQPGLALLGVLTIIFSPRFFAESFYNNKDILFAATYIIAAYFGYRFWKRPGFVTLAAASLSSAVAMNTRVLALIIPVMVISFMLFDVAVEVIKTRRVTRKGWKLMVLAPAFMLLSLVTFLLIHPTSWGREIQFLPEVFLFFSRYNSWSGSTLYFGSLAPYNNLPWHFIPGYLIATTPVTFVVMIGGGLLSFAYSSMRALLDATRRRRLPKLGSLDTFMFAAWMLPLLAVIILQSVLYNSWRHMYFLYFPLVYFLVWGVNSLRKWPLGHQAVLLILTVSYLASGVWMIKNHPNQFAYYSPLVRTRVAANFERDYWHVSSRQVLKEILERGGENDAPIRIWKLDPIVNHIRLMTDTSHSQKVVFVDNASAADYATVLYYNSPETTPWNVSYPYDENWYVRDLSGYEVIKEIMVDGYPLQTLLKKSD